MTPGETIKPESNLLGSDQSLSDLGEGKHPIPGPPAILSHLREKTTEALMELTARKHRLTKQWRPIPGSFPFPSHHNSPRHVYSVNFINYLMPGY